MQGQTSQVLSLYRQLLRKGRQLQLTDKDYFFSLLRKAFQENKGLTSAQEINFQIQQFTVTAMEPSEEFANFLAAIQTGDITAVQEFLIRGQNQACLDSGLCWAARLGFLPLVHVLIDFGADPNAEVWGGFTPILWATIFSGDVDVISYLVSSGADVNHRSSKRKQSALHAAAIKGSPELLECLLASGADLDATDYLFKTPLIHAVQRNLSNCVKVLLHYNCDVNIPGFVNGTRWSPLLVALLQSNLEITKMLILAGAKFEQNAFDQPYTISNYYKTVEDDLNLELRPVYLKQQCRVCIRHLLKPQFLQKLRGINLPNSLKRFLSMEELEWIA